SPVRGTASPRLTLFPYTTLFRSPTERGREKKVFADSVLAGRVDRQLRRRLFGTRPIWVVAEAPLPPGVVAIEAFGTLVAGELPRSEEHTSELQSRFDLVCRLLLE